MSLGEYDDAKACEGRECRVRMRQGVLRVYKALVLTTVWK